MKIIVAIKQVPARDSQLRVDGAGKWIQTSDLSFEINEPDAYALEAALQLKEKNEGTEVTALTVGPAAAADALKKALQMGVDKGVHILDDAIAGSDYAATSRLLAAAVHKLGSETPVDVLMCGMASTDASGSVSVNRVPWPTALSHVIVPPCSWTMPYVIESPRPVPFPISFVVKNGS